MNHNIPRRESVPLALPPNAAMYKFSQPDIVSAVITTILSRNKNNHQGNCSASRSFSEKKQKIIMQLFHIYTDPLKLSKVLQ